jgi:NAD+ kinase
MRIGVVSRLDMEESIQLTEEIVEFLLEKEIKILLDKSVTEHLNKYQDMATPLEDMDADIIIAVGGDGTILRTQSFISSKQIPLFGINMGTVGFLTEIDPELVFKSLEQILTGKYDVEKRTQLQIKHNKKLHTALNEVVIMTRKPAKMLHIEISVDDEVAEELRADGLIVATPSGSTAYSMSAGGPIVDPQVAAFVIVPICPFKLGSRPIVVPDNSVIKVKLLREGKKAMAVIDGQSEEEINYMDEIVFRKSDDNACFVRLSKDFYRKVREKLIKGGITN